MNALGFALFLCLLACGIFLIVNRVYAGTWFFSPYQRLSRRRHRADKKLEQLHRMLEWRQEIIRINERIEELRKDSAFNDPETFLETK